MERLIHPLVASCSKQVVQCLKNRTLLNYKINAYMLEYLELKNIFKQRRPYRLEHVAPPRTAVEQTLSILYDLEWPAMLKMKPKCILF